MNLPPEYLFFQDQLLQWAQTIDRPMPWRGIQDPYKIWLSEIILQQTRVAQGLPYYERFIARYPTVHDLASASEDEVLKTWEGLGYYSRARNMHFTAKYISKELGGVFPDNYKDILALKGVGPYTAAAIASFAFQLPHAVVDGNVYRVLARYFGIEEAIDSTAGKKLFKDLADTLLRKEMPGDYNQAIMDFGAVQCKPKQPDCSKCPLSVNCVAQELALVEKLPKKEKKIRKTDRYFNYLLLNLGPSIFIEKRMAKDIWQGLYQFPLLEGTQLLENEEDLIAMPAWRELLDGNECEIMGPSRPIRQSLSHQNIIARFWEIRISEDFNPIDRSYQKINRKDLSLFAFPKLIDWYLQDKSLYLF